MSENTASPTAEPVRKRSKRTLAWVGGGLALVLVAAGIAVPQIVHAQRVDEYSALVHERDTALADKAEAESHLEAAIALRLAQEGEARSLGSRMVDLGQTPAPILTAEQVQQLTEAGSAVGEVVGEATEPADADARMHEKLVAAVEALRTEDEAAVVAATEAGEEAPQPASPASFLTIGVSDAVELISAERAPGKAQTVADEDVTPEIIDETGAQVASIRAETGELLALIQAEEKRMAEFDAAIESAMPVLQAVAEGASAQAAEVTAQTAKAPDASGVAVAAAQQVNEQASTDDADRILTGLAAYVEATKKAQADHAAVVQREKEEAEAAEAAARAEASRRQASVGGNGGGGGGGKKSRLCSRYRPSPGGGGSLVLVYC
ncbi:hypothetical protein ACFC3F_11625 [Microbacterium sp. NPDC055910]|uniref:hypothetical protein n=1 Tax=Microbacterium sp. NPDC055910 TaxID=3345659 RepID=UPI0035DF6C7A